MHIAFIGLGQIGGSVALAASAAGFATRITAWTPNGTGPEAARGAGIVVAGTLAEAIRGADLVVLAAPPDACLALLDELAGLGSDALARDAVITDVASTKAAIVGRARSLGLRFVGGHPMAGREGAGYKAADPDLFRARPWVIVSAEPPDSAADARVGDLAAACGARLVEMTADDHDSAVAAISHLPLVVSAALVEAMAGAPDRSTAASLAAGGWASMTRLARGDPTMGAGIVATNGPAIAARLRDLRLVLDDWLRLIERDEGGAIDRAAVERRLAAARSVVEDSLADPGDPPATASAAGVAADPGTAGA